MNDLIKLLNEVMELYGYSPEQAAAFIGCSGMQVRRWLAGRSNPSPIFREAISKGLEKMKRERDEGAAWRAPRPAAWTGRDIPAEEQKFTEEMKRVFLELEPRLSDNEKYVIFVANPEYWQGFCEIYQAIRKYKVKLPK